MPWHSPEVEQVESDGGDGNDGGNGGDDQEDDEGMDTAEMQLHALARGVIFVEGELYSHKLWACPGMPEFLLGGEDLLSPLERLKAEDRINVKMA